MTPKQRRFLGIPCSERIDNLLDSLERLAGTRVIFDQKIVPDPIFGTAGGQYHVGEAAPRISLPPGATEMTVAHELLHGILFFEHFPQYRPQYRTVFPFITDVVREVAHCAVHVVVDCRLHALGYEVRAERAEKAEGRMVTLAKIRAEVRDPRLLHWWYIRVAEEIATYATFPTDNSSLAEHFTVQAREHLPGCLGLANRFTSILRKMAVDDPLNVQQSLREMLAAIETEFWAYSYFTNLQRLAIISPVFLTRKQLDDPAQNCVRVDLGTVTNHQKGEKGNLAVVADRLSGATWGIATTKDLIDEKKIALAFEDLAKQPLEEFLQFCQIEYVER